MLWLQRSFWAATPVSTGLRIQRQRKDHSGLQLQCAVILAVNPVCFQLGYNSSDCKEIFLASYSSVLSTGSVIHWHHREHPGPLLVRCQLGYESSNRNRTLLQLQCGMNPVTANKSSVNCSVNQVTAQISFWAATPVCCQLGHESSNDTEIILCCDSNVLGSYSSVP